MDFGLAHGSGRLGEAEASPLERCNGETIRRVVETRGTVIENRSVNDRYKHLSLSLSADVPVAEPGQFFHLLCPGQGEGAHVLRRPMSIYHAERGEVEFLYKVLGVGTRALAELAPGATLNMVGPLGRGFLLEDEWRHIVLVARGVGLATLVPLAGAAAARGIAVTALLSATSPNYLMSVDRLRSAGAEAIAVTDAEATSSVAQVEALLRRLVAERGCDCFATCGSQRLLNLLQRLGGELGIPGQVAVEQNMACGLGACFCCVRPFRTDKGVQIRRVCYEGPVFDMQEALAW